MPIRRTFREIGRIRSSVVTSPAISIAKRSRWGIVSARIWSTANSGKEIWSKLHRNDQCYVQRKRASKEHEKIHSAASSNPLVLSLSKHRTFFEGNAG
jgi:hypothetical protein